MNESQMERLTDVFRTIFNIPDLELRDDMTAMRARKRVPSPKKGKS